MKSACRLAVRNRITLVSLYGWKSEGEIVQISKSGKFFVQLDIWRDEKIREVDIKIINESITVTKIIRGLDEFIDLIGTLDQGILDAILKGTPSKMNSFTQMDNFSVPGLFNLNSSQNEAVKRAIYYKCSIIQGPPGTGKTETAAAIIYHIRQKCLQRPYEIEQERIIFYSSQKVKNLIDDRALADALETEKKNFQSLINRKNHMKKFLEIELLYKIIHAGNTQLERFIGRKTLYQDEKKEKKYVREKLKWLPRSLILYTQMQNMISFL